MIVLDTSVLSLAFRRRKRSRPDPETVTELARLIQEDVPLFVPGSVLQEILSGVRIAGEYRKLRSHMRGFRLLLARESHHLLAAGIYNQCREAGKTFSTIDCLIAAFTLGIKGTLLTTDRDFEAMSPICGLKLHTTTSS